MAAAAAAVAAAAAAPDASSAGGGTPVAGAAPPRLPFPDEAVAGTVLGAITSSYYLTHTTVGFFAARLDQAALDTPSVEDVCRLLCDSPEFAEVPVRHNEDELNAALAKSLPWDARGADFSSPHTKALLLLEARLVRAPLPIADYVNDTKSVLDQSLRVLNALVDVAAHRGRLDAALAAMRLAQCVVQARLPSAPEAAQLPHVGARQVEALDAQLAPLEGLGAPPRGAELAGADADAPLRSLLPRQDAELRRVLGSPAGGLAPVQAAEAVRVLRALPALEVRWSAQQQQTGQGLAAKPRLSPAAGAATATGGSAGGSVLAVVAGGGSVLLSIELQAPPPLAVGRHAYAPRFRQRTYGWWVVLGDRRAARGGVRGGELLAIKRVSLHSGSMRVELAVEAPAAAGARDWQLLVISDTLAGLDVERSIRVVASGGTGAAVSAGAGAGAPASATASAERLAAALAASAALKAEKAAAAAAPATAAAAATPVAVALSRG